jgi:hypothetical protein
VTSAIAAIITRFGEGPTGGSEARGSARCRSTG